MTGTDRIPCINPRCRRTARADHYGGSTEIICGKCFRSLPPALRERYRQLERRLRRVRRAAMRRVAKLGAPAGMLAGSVRMIEIQLWAQWDEIKQHLSAPEKPVGLDGFLQEVGLA